MKDDVALADSRARRESRPRRDGHAKTAPESASAFSSTRPRDRRPDADRERDRGAPRASRPIAAASDDEIAAARDAAAAALAHPLPRARACGIARRARGGAHAFSSPTDDRRGVVDLAFYERGRAGRRRLQRPDVKWACEETRMPAKRRVHARDSRRRRASPLAARCSQCILRSARVRVGDLGRRGVRDRHLLAFASCSRGV